MELPNLLTLILIYRSVIRSLLSENNIIMVRYELELTETSKYEPRCIGCILFFLLSLISCLIMGRELKS